MNLLVWLLVVIAVMLLLAYQRASLQSNSIGLILLWLLLPAFGIGWGWTFFLWLGLAAVLVPLNVSSLRQRHISQPALSFLKQHLPTISPTEQEAMDAGSVWWDGDLFSGNPDWTKLLNFPPVALTAEEQAFIDGPVQQLCEQLNDWEITHQHTDLPPHIWDFLKVQGFFGMIIPKAYGGKEFSAYAHSNVVIKVASRSVSAAVTIMVPNSLGPAKLLLHYGTEEQKRHLLPRLASGDEIPCFALTSPDAGSDAASMKDYGIVTRGTFEGKDDVLGIRLNWEKRYITLGPVATLLGLAFKLYDPDHLLGDQTALGITLALIPTSTPGIRIGRRHIPLNLAFQNGPNEGKNVFIPLDWIIGGPDQIGQGWRMLMECLAEGRSISLPALSTGAGKLSCCTIGAYARIRRQFKMPIGKFEGVAEALARIGGHTYAMEATRRLTLSALDQGERPSVISAISKYHLTERMRKIINDAMDIQGGGGICLGPRNFLGRAYQALPISITVEGANILTRSLIIFGQGAIRCHPFLLKEIQAAQQTNAQQALIAFDQAIFQHVGFITSNCARSLVLGLTGARWIHKPVQDKTGKYFQQLSRMSAAFTLVADLALISLGSALKRKELISARLGDVLSELYIASASLKHYQDQRTPHEDLPLVRWVCEDSLFRMQEKLEMVLDNFPHRALGKMIKWIVFPLGKPYQKPSDHLTHQISKLLIHPSASHQRLSEGLFTPNADDGVGRINHAWHKVIAAEEIEKKIHKKLKENQVQVEYTPEQDPLDDLLTAGVVTQSDIQILRDAEAARRESIMVDDFSPDLRDSS